MLWIATFLIAAAAGVIHTITGFGSVIIMMLVLPYFLDMIAAPALASAINLGLSLMLVVKFRKHIDLKLIPFPLIPYLICSVSMIQLVDRFDLQHLAVAFGGFLILLSAYFLLFSKYASVKGTRVSAALCGAVSGICSGLFGIGGPLMALYFLAITKDKASYTGNLQFFFLMTCLVNLISRVSRGFYTLELVPLTLLGFVAINVGKSLGLRILDRLDPQRIRTLVYLFVGFSGLLTVVKNIL